MLVRMFLLLGLLSVLSSFNPLSFALTSLPFVLVKLCGTRLKRWTILGLATPILPLFGSGTLLASVILILFLEENQKLRQSVLWASPFLLLLLFWVSAQFWYGFDPTIFYYVSASPDPIEHLSRFVRESPPQYLFSMQSATRWLVFAALLHLFSNQKDYSMNFLGGLVWGVGLSVVFGILQIVGLLEFPNQSAYWRALSRYPSSFTDPNAFGVFSALVLPFLLLNRDRGSGRNLFTALVLIALTILYSGSRTFFVGVVVGALTYICAKLGSKRVIYAIAFLLIAVVLINLTGILEAEATRTLVADLPPAAQRVVQALSLSAIGETFYSRLIFWKIAWNVFLDNPLFGVGFGEFRSVVAPYAEGLRLQTGIWTDNANSFYLGVLAELGIIGALALLLCFRGFRLRRDEQGLYLPGVVSVAALIAMLIFGPHLDFDEVAVISAFIMAAVFLLASECSAELPGFISMARTEGVFGRRIVCLLISLSVVSLIFVIERASPQGVYSWELDSSGSLYRWSAARSSFQLTCHESEDADIRKGGFKSNRFVTRLKLQSLDPLVGTAPQHVRVSSNGQEQALELRDNQLKEIPIDCGYAGRVNVSLKVSPAWSPLERGMSDPRILGVTIR